MGPVNTIQAVWRRATRHRWYAALTLGITAIVVGIATIVCALFVQMLSTRGVANALDVVAFPGVPIEAATLTPNLASLRSVHGSLVGVAAYIEGPVNVLARDEAVELHGAQISDNFFDLLGARPYRGRLTDAGGRRDAVVVSRSLARRVAGDETRAVGASITVNGHTLSVVGVVRDLDYPVGTDVWLPFGVGNDTMIQDSLVVWGVARARPGATTREVAAALQSGGLPGTPAIERLGERTRRRLQPVLQWLSAAVGCLFLLALATFTLLQMLHLVGRREELITRAALGATQAKLFAGLAAEGVTLAAAGGAIGLMIASWGWAVLVSVLPPPSALPADLEPLSMLVGIGLAIGCNLLASGLGLVPLLSRLRLATNTSARAVGLDRWGRRFASALVVTQVAAAAGLAVMSVAMLNSVRTMLDVDRGFDPGTAFQARITLPRYRYANAADRARFFSQLVDTLRSQPLIDSAGAVSSAPFAARSVSVLPIRTAAEPDGGAAGAVVKVATPDYFRAVGARLIRGRGLSAADTPGSPPVAVVSEQLAAQLFPGRDALGERIAVPGTKLPVEVVGLIGNIGESLDGSHPPVVYLPFAQRPRAAMAVVLRTSLPGNDAATLVQRAVKDIDPQQPLSDASSLEALIARAASRERLTSVTVTVLAICALLIATAGVHGVTALSLRNRLREIGLRASLGATPRSLVCTLLWTGVRPLAVGATVGTVSAAVLLPILQRTWPALGVLHPGAIALGAAAIVCPALFSILAPIARVARLSPATIFRHVD